MNTVQRPLPGIFDHGEEELARAKAILARHEATPRHECTCDGPWPCPVADIAADWAAYWEYRLEIERGALRVVIEGKPEWST